MVTVSSPKNVLWVEKYRPNKVVDMILPARIKTAFQKMVDDRNLTNLLLCGGPGMGKTSVALAALEEIGCDYYFVNASLDRKIEMLRNEISEYSATVSFSGGRKYIVLDEADHLTSATQPALRSFLETTSENCGYIFTANYKDKIIAPLQSRFVVIDFHTVGAERNRLAVAFYKRVLEILEAEAVAFDKKTVARIVDKFFPDMRRTIHELQYYSNLGPIDEKVLVLLAETDFTRLLDFMIDKDFTNARKWLAENPHIDSAMLFRRFYDTAREHLEPTSIPPFVVLLGKYQYQQHFVADPEINMAAAIAEISSVCRFKQKKGGEDAA